MKLNKRNGARPLFYYLLLTAPMMTVFIYKLITNASNLMPFFYGFILVNIIALVVSYTINFDRFFCSLSGHPNKELIRVHNNKTNRKAKDLVLVEYHCPLCNVEILEQKNYQDIN